MSKYRIGANLPSFEPRYRKTIIGAWGVAQELARLYHKTVFIEERDNGKWILYEKIKPEV